MLKYKLDKKYENKWPFIFVFVLRTRNMLSFSLNAISLFIQSKSLSVQNNKAVAKIKNKENKGKSCRR